MDRKLKPTHEIGPVFILSSLKMARAKRDGPIRHFLTAGMRSVNMTSQNVAEALRLLVPIDSYLGRSLGLQCPGNKAFSFHF